MDVLCLALKSQRWIMAINGKYRVVKANGGLVLRSIILCVRIDHDVHRVENRPKPSGISSAFALSAERICACHFKVGEEVRRSTAINTSHEYKSLISSRCGVEFDNGYRE